MTEHSVLYVYVDPSNVELFNMYEDQMNKHNNEVLNGSHPNSGFDLFLPRTYNLSGLESNLVNYEIKCEMIYYDTISNRSRPSAFYLYPRSSLSKTMLMLANHVGIIDSGYRGNIMAAFRVLAKSIHPVQHEKGERLVQICAPDLKPFIVKLVDETFLSNTTRGAGGFGSTGK